MGTQSHSGEDQNNWSKTISVRWSRYSSNQNLQARSKSAVQLQWESILILNWPKYRNWTNHAMCFRLQMTFFCRFELLKWDTRQKLRKCCRYVMWDWDWWTKRENKHGCDMQCFNLVISDTCTYLVMYWVQLGALHAQLIFMISTCTLQRFIYFFQCLISNHRDLHMHFQPCMLPRQHFLLFGCVIICSAYACIIMCSVKQTK